MPPDTTRLEDLIFKDLNEIFLFDIAGYSLRYRHFLVEA